MEAREAMESSIHSGSEEEDEDSPFSTPSPPAVVISESANEMVPAGIPGGGDDVAAAQKKRGRPRKYGPDGLPSSAHPSSSSAPLSPSSADLAGKRSRGRPPGSGARQVLATLGELFACTAGGSFTPHVITIAAGEDVAARIQSLSQKGPRAVCILSANGAISNVTLRQPGSSGGTLTYEGRFEILSLSGSYSITELSGVRSRTGGISVSLAGPDGRVVGGGVAGSLLAASPIQVIVGSFLPNILKDQKRRSSVEQSTLSPAATSIQTSPVVLTAATPLSQGPSPVVLTAAMPLSQGPSPVVLTAAMPLSQGSRPVVFTAAMPISQVNPDTYRMTQEIRREPEDTMNFNSNTNSSSFPTGWSGLQQPPTERKTSPSPDINLSLPGL